jgi:hypothetical protein
MAAAAALKSSPTMGHRMFSKLPARGAQSPSAFGLAMVAVSCNCHLARVHAT